MMWKPDSLVGRAGRRSAPIIKNGARRRARSVQEVIGAVALLALITPQSGCGLFAQKVKFETNPPNQEFQIDGTTYRDPVTLWLSRHKEHQLIFRNFKGDETALRLPTVDAPVPFPGRVFGTPVTINYSEESQSASSGNPVPADAAPPTAAVEDLPLFRGLRLGMALQAQVPECPRDQYLYRYAGYTCWEQNYRCFNQVRGLPPMESLKCGQPDKVTFVDNLGSVIGMAATVTQRDGKLVAMRGRFSPVSKVEQAEEVFRAKYGSPKVTREEPWQSKGGVRTTAVVRVWEWNRLLIQLRAPDEDLETGGWFAASQEYLKSLGDEREQQLRRAAEDL